MKYLECQTLFGINQKKLFLQMYFVQKELKEIKGRLLHMEIMVGCTVDQVCSVISSTTLITKDLIRNFVFVSGYFFILQLNLYFHL